MVVMLGLAIYATASHTLRHPATAIACVITLVLNPYVALPLCLMRGRRKLVAPRRAVDGSVALATDERDFGRDECRFLKRDGLALLMHKIGRQKTAQCSLPA